jgi:hypothetical protein
MRLKMIYIILISGVIVTFYLSWISQPDLSRLRYIPAWLGRWTNAHDTFRTAVPLVFLGLFSGILLRLKKRPLRWWIYSWLCLVIIVSVAEFGQLFLSRRVADWRDIVWGSAGAFTGLAIVYIISIVAKALNNSRG